MKVPPVKCRGCGGEKNVTTCMASGELEGHWHPDCLREARRTYKPYQAAPGAKHWDSRNK